MLSYLLILKVKITLAFLVAVPDMGSIFLDNYLLLFFVAFLLDHLGPKRFKTGIILVGFIFLSTILPSKD